MAPAKPVYRSHSSLNQPILKKHLRDRHLRIAFAPEKTSVLKFPLSWSRYFALLIVNLRTVNMLQKFSALGLKPDNRGKDMKKVALLAVAIVMAGCASINPTESNSTEPNRHNWAKNGASHDEIMRDLNSCKQQERQRSVQEGYNTSKNRDVIRVSELVHVCMEEKGYREK